MMQIFWTSKHRLRSLNSPYSTLTLSFLVVGTLSLGFLAGKFYHQHFTIATPEILQSTAAQHQATPEKVFLQRLKALTAVLAELQAKLMTLETIQKEVNTALPNNTFLDQAISHVSRTKQSTNLTHNSSADHLAQGGRYLPYPYTNQSHRTKVLQKNLEEKKLDELISFGLQSLESVRLFESELQSLHYEAMYQNNNSYFVPSLVPVGSGRLSSTFGIRTDPINRRQATHEGLDFAAPEGTPIYASATGIVDWVRTKGDYGKHLKIKHLYGYSTLYAHCSKILVKKGQTVQKGQLIAYIGKTGRVTGAHLHFEVHKDGVPIDPERTLKLAYFVK